MAHNAHVDVGVLQLRLATHDDAGPRTLAELRDDPPEGDRPLFRDGLTPAALPATVRLDGEVERACQVGHDALALSRTIGSARVTERRGEPDTAPAPYGQLSYVQEFKELFRLVTADAA